MPKKNGKLLWVALLTVYVVWGSTYLAIRVAVETIPPLLMASVRFLVAGTILYGLSIRSGDARADSIGRGQWGAAAIVGGLLLLGGNGGLVWAEQHIASGVAALILSTVPMWMALFASFAGERLNRATVVGLGIGFAGTALLLRAADSGGGAVNLAAASVVVFASLSWALGSVLARRLPLPKRPLVATALEMLAGGALLGVAALIGGELGRLDLSKVSLASSLSVGYLIVFGSLLAFSAYVWVLHNTSTALTSTYAYVNPLIAVLLGWAILEERFTHAMLFAAALILGAVALIIRARPPRDHDAAVASSPAAAPPSPGEATFARSR